MPDQPAPDNQTIVMTRPSSDEVMLVIAVVLDPETLDLQQLLTALVPEMARGGVRGGLLVVGDSTLVLRLEGQEVAVEEVHTESLLALADIDEPWSREHIVELMQRWVVVLREDWRDRLVGHLRELLVPHIVAGLAGEMEVAPGIWGLEAHRLVQPEED